MVHHQHFIKKEDDYPPEIGPQEVNVEIQNLTQSNKVIPPNEKRTSVIFPEKWPLKFQSPSMILNFFLEGIDGTFPGIILFHKNKRYDFLKNVDTAPSTATRSHYLRLGIELFARCSRLSHKNLMKNLQIEKTRLLNEFGASSLTCQKWCLTFPTTTQSFKNCPEIQDLIDLYMEIKFGI